MDNQRLLLVAALSLVLLMIWQAWMKDYGGHTPAPHAASPTAPTPAPQPESSVPQLPATPKTTATAPAPTAPATAAAQPAGRTIEVRTDVLNATISTIGGTLRRVALPHFAVSTKKPRRPVVLLDDADGRLFLAQSGLLAEGTSKAPTHHARFSAAHDHYRLPAGAKELHVRLTWTSPAGVTVDKIYTFRRNSYVVRLREVVHNAGTKPWRARPYEQLLRLRPKKGSSMFLHTYVGGAIYSPQDKFQKVSFKDMTKNELDRAITGGWVAMDQHYFLAAWIPAAHAPERFYTKALADKHFVVGTMGAALDVAPGQSRSIDMRLYVGPKLQERLAGVAPGLDLTVDYGYLTVLAKPIFAMLRWIEGLVGNWGWAIVILTILIKLAFYKLSETSYRSMANMRRLAPRLKSLKERYGDDRQRLNQAMMELYKKEKINPLGGCLPIVVQIPVFIALYWVLLESMELRQAPFIFWIHDLSAPDPYFVLPILNGITMLVQQRLNPSPLDPMQQKIMMIMPLMFAVFFAFFPAGLVLYWLVNNMLSITQQWVITRRVEQGATT